MCVWKKIKHTQSHLHTHTQMTKIATERETLNMIDWGNERNKLGKSYPNLHVWPHTHTQTNIHQNNIFSKTHLFFCVKHFHTLSHSLHLWQPLQLHVWWESSHIPLILPWQPSEGVSKGKKIMLKTKKMKEFFLPFPPLSLSLSLSPFHLCVFSIFCVSHHENMWCLTYFFSG